MSDSAAKAAENPRDFTKYADKAPSDLQARFAKWILDVTGYEPEDQDSFDEGVRLATALRMAFQASPENQEVLEARRAEALDKKNAPKPARKTKAKAKKVEETEEADDAEEDEDDEAEETPEPEPVKRKPGKRVKKPADDAEEDEGAEAPF